MIEYILSSAIWYSDVESFSYEKANPSNIKKGVVLLGYRHDNIIAKAHCLFNKKTKQPEDVQGFLTSKNRFINRKDAAVIAYNANQTNKLKKELTSEDLY